MLPETWNIMELKKYGWAVCMFLQVQDLVFLKKLSTLEHPEAKGSLVLHIPFRWSAWRCGGEGSRVGR